MKPGALVAVGVGLVLLGVFLVFLGALMSGLKKGRLEAGGVVLLGPFPVVFGTSREAVLVSVLLGLFLLLITIWVLYSYS